MKLLLPFIAPGVLTKKAAALSVFKPGMLRKVDNVMDAAPKMRTVKGPASDISPPRLSGSASTPSAGRDVGILERIMSSRYKNPAIVGGVTAGGFGLGHHMGNKSGQEAGLNEGLLTAQQMLAYQQALAQQQARSTYANQGFLDRLMGRNPFE